MTVESIPKTEITICIYVLGGAHKISPPLGGVFILIYISINNIVIVGHSPSGKARDFDSRIRRFESYMPSLFKDH